MTPPGDRPFYRFEFKYELRPNIAELIDAEIKRFGMRPDGHARLSDGSYVVSSLYFDSFDFNNVLAESGAAIIAGNINVDDGPARLVGRLRSLAGTRVVELITGRDATEY